MSSDVNGNSNVGQSERDVTHHYPITGVTFHNFWCIDWLTRMAVDDANVNVKRDHADFRLNNIRSQSVNSSDETRRNSVVFVFLLCVSVHYLYLILFLGRTRSQMNILMNSLIFSLWENSLSGTFALPLTEAYLIRDFNGLIVAKMIRRRWVILLIARSQCES